MYAFWNSEYLSIILWSLLKYKLCFFLFPFNNFSLNIPRFSKRYFYFIKFMIRALNLLLIIVYLISEIETSLPQRLPADR